MPAAATLPSDPAERTRMIVEACLAMGFARAGVAPAAPASRPAAFLKWLGAGKHGEMGYMAERVETRLDVGKLLPGAQSVIVLADQYAPRGAGDSEAAAEAGDPTSATGGIAKYARGRDYHRVIRDRLHALADRLRAMYPGCECVSFVDTGPVLEREHAARAGLGFIGKHTLLIDPRLGSYLLLGGIATTLELAPTGEPVPVGAGGTAHTDHCGTCTRCIDACPTSAITPYSVDATRCISYLTLEHEGPIDPALQTKMGSWVAGCDVCQDVCPYNEPHGGPDAEPARVNAAYIEDPARAKGGRGPRLVEMIGWSEEDRRRVLSGSAAKRASLDMIRRNAAIALANVRGTRA